MNHSISLKDAAGMTRLFREHREAKSVAASTIFDLLPLCETFDRAAFDSLLSQPDCQAIRIYYGMTPDEQIHAIVVGVNGTDEDILPTSAGTSDAAETTTADDGGIVEMSFRCPPLCPPTSPLNS